MNALCFRYFPLVILALVLMTGCDIIGDKPGKPRLQPAVAAEETGTAAVEPLLVDTHVLHEIEPGELEKSIIKEGLVNVQDVDSTIRVDLKYSTTDNFLGIDVYGDLENCYLQPDVAEKLALAQMFLKSKYPYYSIIVYDGVRPRRIQKLMWDTINVERSERPKYLSNPQYGSLHNFGAAVDVSIVNQEGIALDMGTPYDFFGDLAYPELEKKMLEEGRLTQRQVLNRELLRNVMERAGFFNIQTEWWHFNSCYRREAMRKYRIVE